MAIRNAFSAFGFEPDAATIDTLRTDLAYALRQFIKSSGMGQAKIGEVLGLKQSVVSQIKNGSIDHLSVERLIRAMVKAKIAGFAEWGADAESACAGAGVRVTPSLATTVYFAPTIGDVYKKNWSESARAANVAATRQSRRSKLRTPN
jgi:predicted XRE-type DNA-binding protein